MPQRWAIWFAIEGDLRFLSHHDLMRATERIAGRAELPLRYSQGFNPRPKLSLVCPRPVGVATQDDLLVAALDAPMEGEEILKRLNAHTPRGMRFLRARQLEDSTAPQPVRTHCQLPIAAEKIPQVQKQLKELDRSTCWPVERQVSTRRGKAKQAKTIDLRLLVERIDLDGEQLCISLISQGDLWARPGEVLRLVGLDERADLARMVRTKVEYET